MQLNPKAFRNDFREPTIRVDRMLTDESDREMLEACARLVRVGEFVRCISKSRTVKGRDPLRVRIVNARRDGINEAEEDTLFLEVMRQLAHEPYPETKNLPIDAINLKKKRGTDDGESATWLVLAEVRQARQEAVLARCALSEVDFIGSNTPADGFPHMLLGSVDVAHEDLPQAHSELQSEIGPFLPKTISLEPVLLQAQSWFER